jgi:pheromone shutdown-related protein TraB
MTLDDQPNPESLQIPPKQGFIHILGTNHISKNSIEEIKQKFLELDPDIIAVELDKGRLQQLLHPPKDDKVDFRLIKRLGVKGFIFALIAKYLQQKLGKMVGVKPGSEMLQAVQLAKNNNKQLALIDKPIDKTIRRLMKQITFKEKRRFVYDIFFSKFSKQKVKVDISNVPDQELITTLIGHVKVRYPTVARVLIDERNHFMARKLITLHKTQPSKDILAVVGAGHKKEMDQLVKELFHRIELV